MVSLVQDERQPHWSQGGVGMLLSITFSQKGHKRVGIRLLLTEHNMAPVHGILEGKYFDILGVILRCSGKAAPSGSPCFLRGIAETHVTKF